MCKCKLRLWLPRFTPIAFNTIPVGTVKHRSLASDYGVLEESTVKKDNNYIGFLRGGHEYEVVFT